MRIIDDVYGRESLRFTVYWRGPHATGGTAPGLRIDITRNEVLAFPPVSRPLSHRFSDADAMGEIRLRCYSLEEVMAEKIRAVLGQRIYAVSRDLYDIHSLLEQVDEQEVLAGLPRKLVAREVDPEAIHLHRLTKRKDEFRADWARNLTALLPPGSAEEFDDVWNAVAEYVGRIATAVP